MGLCVGLFQLLSSLDWLLEYHNNATICYYRNNVESLI